MTKLEIVQRFYNTLGFLATPKNAVITCKNDKICINDVEANEEMQAFYNQLTPEKILAMEGVA